MYKEIEILLTKILIFIYKNIKFFEIYIQKSSISKKLEKFASLP